MHHHRTALFSILVAVLVTIPALGTTQRSFVSHNGLDTNPCSVDSPCRSFATAILQTNASGEVVAVDSAGYGPLTISQAVTLVAPLGTHAGISVLSGDGVTVTAASNAVVVLRNLYINAQGGVNGITLTSASSLHIEHCVVSGFSGSNINLVPTVAASVVISDTVSRQATGDGIYADSASQLTVSIDHCRMELNLSGVFANRATLDISNSTSAINGLVGFWANGSGGPASMTIESCVASDNGTAGIQVNNGNVVVHNTSATRNHDWNIVVTGSRLSAENCVMAGASYGVLVVSSGDVSVAHSTIADNSTAGIGADTAGIVRLNQDTITRNAIGIDNSSGTISSMGNNMVDGNTTNTSGTIGAANKA